MTATAAQQDANTIDEIYRAFGVNPVSLPAVQPKRSIAPPPPKPKGMADYVLDRSELAQLPEPEPLIEDTIDLRTVALLAGYWGTGKSFLGLDWAASVATGRPWQGRQTTQGRVLYIAAEGAYGLHQRLTAWESAWQRTIDPKTLHVLPAPVNLGNDKHVAEAAALIRAQRFQLVVIDTVARCAVGLDENSAKDMGKVVDALYRLKNATAAGTVLAIHHTGKDRATIRGSSALEAGVDTVYQIEGDPGLLKLERTKRKDGPLADVHQLGLEPIPGTGSVVLQATRGLGKRPTAETLLSQFVTSFSQAGASKSELRQASGMASSSFYRALNDLLAQGEIVNVGTDKRPHYRLGDAHV